MAIAAVEYRATLFDVLVPRNGIFMLKRMAISSHRLHDFAGQAANRKWPMPSAGKPRRFVVCHGANRIIKLNIGRLKRDCCPLRLFFGWGCGSTTAY